MIQLDRQIENGEEKEKDCAGGGRWGRDVGRKGIVGKLGNLKRWQSYSIKGTVESQISVQRRYIGAVLLCECC